ncbi:MAG: EAL domain-containing protein [Xanthomonadales bacterium]|nr:EAL domain-containing protein [Xanthomonadales bacterium]
MVLAIGILGVALPLFAALHIALRQSKDDAINFARTMAVELVRRFDAAGEQAMSANQRLKKFVDADPCSDARLQLMREIGLSSSYLEVVGYVADGRLICSSLGRHGDGIPLGPMHYVSARGAIVRTSVDLGLHQGERFLVLEREHCAAALHIEMLTDIFMDRDDVGLGLLGQRGTQLMSSRGPFHPDWIPRLAGARSVAQLDDRYLLVTQPSTKFDAIAYVAIPAAYLRERLISAAMILAPLAIILGTAITVGVLRIARQRFSMIAVLRTALRRRELILHYQPIVELASRRVVGVEALLRWPLRGGRGFGPDLFVPLAEHGGLAPQLTRYVLGCVAADAPRLLEELPDCYVSVNLASSDLHSEAILDALRLLLSDSGMRPSNLLIEATEHSFLDAGRARPIVAAIRDMGVRVAIDDFGTGYSSLSHLANLQIDLLKIDKVFVDAVGTDSVTSQVALHIIDIAETLGMKIIAEGVETELQARFLRDHGVQFAQGWLFHRAMPLEELIETLAAANGSNDVAAATGSPSSNGARVS